MFLAILADIRRAPNEIYRSRLQEKFREMGVSKNYYAMLFV